MKREKRLTKREQKAQKAATSGVGHQHHHHDEQHIHCISCGRHLDIQEFDEPARARFIRCNHGTEFPTCVGCEAQSRTLLEAHDRSGQPVKTAAAWH